MVNLHSQQCVCFGYKMSQVHDINGSIHQNHSHLKCCIISFTIQSKYVDKFLSNTLRVVIGQLRVSSRQLKVENGCTNGVLKEERICRLCHIEIEMRMVVIGCLRRYTSHFDVTNCLMSQISSQKTLMYVSFFFTIDTHPPRLIHQC